MFELTEHTADIGIRVRAATFEALLADAARGLFSLIVVDLDAVQPTETLRVTIPGDEPEFLLLDWLSELLYRFDTRHMLLSAFDVKIRADGGIEGAARGERYDPNRHELDHEIKAITYHDLSVRQSDAGWEGTIIVDV